MKNLILIAVTTLLAHATANAETVIAEVKGADAQIQKVQLTSNGILKVYMTNNKSEVLTLSNANAQALLQETQELSSVEVVTERRAATCKMMPQAGDYQQLFVRSSQNGGLTMILTSDTCVFVEYTHPKLDYQVSQAQQLEAKLVTLARQLE